MQGPWDGLGKHVPIATQLQQLDYNNGNGGVFYVVRAKMSWAGQFEATS
jgi:hypothetical protein